MMAEQREAKRRNGGERSPEWFKSGTFFAGPASKRVKQVSYRTHAKEGTEMSSTTTSRKVERPDVQWVNGTCPCCGEDTVSNAYYVGGRAGQYILVQECWASLGEPAQRTCDYRIELKP